MLSEESSEVLAIECGAGKRNRTPDLLITNELLYRRQTGVLPMFLTVPVCFIRRKYANGFNHTSR